MKEPQQVHYNPIYGRILIVLGIVFTGIFILGYFVADITESIFYCALTALMIIVGFNITKGPYAVYDEHNIILYNFWYKERERYEFKRKDEITVKNNLFYFNGKKLKMNSWFIRKADWRRMVEFYSSSDDTLLSELKD